MSNFPQELTDKVIDFGAVDSSEGHALKTYGLVCKGWLPRSRYHLFSTVTLTAEKLASFVDIVDTSSIPILPLVRFLKLLYSGRPLDTLHLARLHLCPNLTAIEIEIKDSRGSSGMDWLRSEELLQTHIRSWSANAAVISCLTLKANIMMYIPVCIVISLLSCVPSVEAVCIQVDGIERGKDVYPPHVPTRLAHLDIRPGFMADCSPLFDWILSLPALPIFKSLKYNEGFGFGLSTQGCIKFIQQTGGELESLFFHMIIGDATALFRNILTYTPKLRNLSFLCHGPAEILEIIPLLPSSTLNALDISVFTHDDPTSWSAIDEALAEPQFNGLQRLSVSSDTKPALASSRTRLLLPLVAARGIIAEPLDTNIRIWTEPFPFEEDLEPGADA
ncbi:hypothetical protein MVEN_01590000 [Mycena venus]|uniref:Uncharacterized protein n=1 Tax=Mycena venus TaxID=2733690 RepID=A0A8H7CPT6_9AGAR|nr:hypothetical protein MVEN_01590000 [Mycena venus]